MRKKHTRKLPKPKRPKAKLGLPDLDHSRSAVLDGLRSPESKRGYRHAIDEFVQWYCSEPRLSFKRLWSHVTVFTLKTDSSPQELLTDDSLLYGAWLMR